LILEMFFAHTIVQYVESMKSLVIMDRIKIVLIAERKGSKNTINICEWSF
jgi:hypothetical protein